VLHICVSRGGSVAIGNALRVRAQEFSALSAEEHSVDKLNKWQHEGLKAIEQPLLSPNLLDCSNTNKHDAKT
jgi:hypothetical protein